MDDDVAVDAAKVEELVLVMVEEALEEVDVEGPGG